MNSNNSRHAEWIHAAMDRYAGPLTRYAMTITGDLDSARDVVQDTFVRLCSENATRLDSRLPQWLFTVCRNRALDFQRKEKRMEPLSEIRLKLEASPEPSPSAQAEQRETSSRVLDVVARLPKNQQEVIRLKFQNGLSYKEISKVTRLTVSNVGFLIHTAIKAIRHQLRSKPLATDNLRKAT
jgi:RNA polymerase sigma factor (sigma-70 family)